MKAKHYKHICFLALQRSLLGATKPRAQEAKKQTSQEAAKRRRQERAARRYCASCSAVVNLSLHRFLDHKDVVEPCISVCLLGYLCSSSLASGRPNDPGQDRVGPLPGTGFSRAWKRRRGESEVSSKSWVRFLKCCLQFARVRKSSRALPRAAATDYIATPQA